MKLVKVSAAVLNQTPLDWNGNRDRILAAVAAARQDGVSVLCLPELCISGYGCEDAFQSPAVQQMARDVLAEIVPHTRGLVVSLGLPLAYQHALFNTAALVVDGQVLGFVAKQFLAGDGIHYEPRWFKPWPAGRRAEVSLAGRTVPLGDLDFHVGGIKIGFEICEDAWVAQRPGAELARRGVDILLNPSASHFAFGKMEVRHRFVLEGSRTFGASYVYANLLGNEAGRAIYDGGALVASGGNLIAAGPRFSFADWHLTTAIVDVDATRMQQSRLGSFQPRLDVAETTVTVPFEYPPLLPAHQKAVRGKWETGPHAKEEEFARAVALALFDYMRKSRSNGVVISASGGADSSAVACLAALMIDMGVAELGLAGLKKKLVYLPQVQNAQSTADLIRELIVCVYQATQNSSSTTRNAAAGVAAGIGAQFYEFDVEALVAQYIALAGKAIGRELTWGRDDVALQNIQARVRAPGVWMLANLRSGLLLSTSNRSEAAVGYATMDGDTSGGLSPIAGIDKAYLRSWLRWLETVGPEGLHPVPALAAVNCQAPTAELRPAGANQTDEDDLMPYELLDAIERAAIRDKLSPVEVFQHMQPRFPQYSVQQLGIWVERFFRLWCRNQWKRERYAPSFHLDDENLDPKTWCRFPILSGGYERELAVLRAYIAEIGSR